MNDEPVASQAERPDEATASRDTADRQAPTESPTGNEGSTGTEGSGPSGEATGAPRRRRSRGGRGRGRGGGSRPAGGSAQGSDGDDDVTHAARPRSRRPQTETDGAGEGDGEETPRAPRPARAPRAPRPRPEASGDDADGASAEPRAPRTRRPPRPKPEAGGEEAAAGSGDETDGDGANGDDDGTTSTGARRRRRRGGRGRRRPGSSPQSGMSPDSAEAATEAGLATSSAEQAQRDDALPDESSDDSAGPSNGRRRRTRSGTGAATASGRTRTRTRSKPEEGDGQGEGSRPVSTRRMKAEPVRVRGRRTRRDMPRPVKRRTDKRMVITEIDERDQIAVLEGRELVEHYITRSGAKSMVGNIYVGRVQNVLPGMEAAFIDIGRGRNGVLYAGEVNYDEEVEGGGKATRIEEALKSGQRVTVQVTKDPLGGKGARLTAQISLPGRFLVFVPNQQVFGISRRLPDDERARLRDILKPIRPDGSGVIARTAAEGASAEDLESDLKRLEREWAEVEKRAKKAKPASSVYEEPELTVRVVRDVFTEGEFEEVVTDSKIVHDKITEYLQDVAPELTEKVRLHEGPLPVMEEFHVTEQVRKALERKVWLESGGYLIIDRTEAMTVIDVNTGKHVGKTNLEETVTQTNIEAAEEIARQLRLRDIGGMIIIDFIDMLLEKNRGKVIRAVKSALAKDRTRSQVFDISPLGLLEVTRKKVSAGLVESFSETCPTCEGRGILLTHES